MMINGRRTVSTLLLACSLSAASWCYGAASEGQTSIQDVKRQTTEFLQTLKSYSAEQRDQAMEKTRAALADLDRRIDALEQRTDDNWDRMDASAREHARASLKELREQRIKLAEWYGSLKNSSAGAWDHMKQGFSDAYRSMQHAWEQSVEEFRADQPASGAKAP